MTLGTFTRATGQLGDMTWRVTATHRTHYHGLTRTAQALTTHWTKSICESILLFPVFSYLSLLLKCITMIQDNLKYTVSKVYFIVGI